MKIIANMLKMVVKKIPNEYQFGYQGSNPYILLQLGEVIQYRSVCPQDNFEILITDLSRAFDSTSTNYSPGCCEKWSFLEFLLTW